MTVNYRLAEVSTGNVVDCGTDLPIYSAEGFSWEWGYGHRLTALPGQFRLEQEEVADVEPGNLKPTPPEFMLLLTLRERAAFRAAAAKDPVVNDLLTLLSDSRLTYVDLANAGVQEAVQYMTTTDPQLLTEARAKRILAGLPPESAA